ncbi:MAG: NAD-dependent epimerase/dehydratase family protein [Gemmatimonadota bacterium]
MREITLVTGATGFIGSHLIRQLVAGGSYVRVFVRRPEALDPSLRPRLHIAQGDIRDREALTAAVRGATTVLHLAACARAWTADAAEFEEVNVRAVECLLAAARRYRVRRLVHVSTALTRPAGAGTAPLTRPAAGEIEQAGPGRALTLYERTKLEGERRVEAYAKEGRHAAIVHPTRVYGPGPLNDANGVTKVIAFYLSGRFRVRIADRDVRANYVHAADVARGIRLAAELSGTGAHYILGGDTNLSFRDFLELIAELSGVRRRVVPIPPAVALAVAHAARAWGRVGGRVSITPGWVRVFLEDRPVDISAARSEIGYRPRDLRDGLRETIAWLRARRQALPEGALLPASTHGRESAA